MLTATYSLVAIRAEQKITRSILNRLREYIRRGWSPVSSPALTSNDTIDVGALELTLSRISQFDLFVHARKVEVNVFPALRGTSQEFDALAEDLSACSAEGAQILTELYDQLQRVLLQEPVARSHLYRAMERFCDAVSRRLALEEERLFPLLDRLLSMDEWFSLGAQFLSDDGNRYSVHRRVPPPVLPQLSVAI